MKKQILFILCFFVSIISIAQSKSITITVKTTIEQMTEVAKTELIVVDENNKSLTKLLPHLFNYTEEHERLVQEEINKATSKGFKLVNSSSMQYGGVKGKYYLITRYVFTQG
jgi:HKD family nuclease